ncbi:MAG: hypothetical protein WAN36_03485, partial [Calditrichia bacterium]
NLPPFPNDRGAAIPTSLFGTFIRPGELLVYPFFEYQLDNNREYQPAQYGYGKDEDFRAKFHGSSEQIYVGYGFTDWLVAEFEFAYMDVRFEKSPDDHSPLPPKIHETGLGDFEGQIRMRWAKETKGRPEIFGFLDVTVPSQNGKLLIRDPDWNFKPGIGVIKSFSWGTLLFRTDLEYNREASSPDIGETAIEYLRRFSPSGLLNLGIEGGEGGAPDEWNLITGVHLRLADWAYLKLNNSLGITSKATDWVPQGGLLFSFPIKPHG